MLGTRDRLAALTAARLCEAAYAPTVASRTRWCEAAGCKLADWWDEDGAQAVAAHDRARSVSWLAVAGTNERIDVARDLDAHMVESRAAGVHRGFLDATQPLLAEALPWLAGGSIGRVVITGHSLGGAVALLLARELVLVGRADLVECVWTIAAPRPGDWRLAEQLLDVEVIRLFGAGDPVPHLPPALMGYRHIGDTRYLDRADRYRRAPGALAILADKAIATAVRWRGMPFERKAAEHSLAGRYIPALERVAARPIGLVAPRAAAEAAAG